MQGMANNIVIHLYFTQNQVQTMAVVVKLVSPSTLLMLLVSLSQDQQITGWKRYYDILRFHSYPALQLFLFFFFLNISSDIKNNNR